MAELGNPETVNQMKKLLLSLATPEIREIAEPFLQNHKEWAERHGFVYQCAEEVVWKHLHPSFSRVAMLDKAMKDGVDIAIWADSDIAFLDMRRDLSDLLGDDYYLAAYHQQNWVLFPYLCCGLMVWKNTPESRAFIAEWMDRCLNGSPKVIDGERVKIEGANAREPLMQAKPWEQWYFSELIREVKYKGIRCCNAWEIGSFCTEIWFDSVRFEPGMPTVHMAGDAPWERRVQVFNEIYKPLIRR